MSQLKILNLRYNNLEYLRYELFLDLEEIEEIDLSENNIGYMIQIGIRDHSTLRMFTLKGNPLLCNRCYNAWLRSMPSSVLKDRDETVCHQPQHLQGSPVSCYTLTLKYNHCFNIALPSSDTWDYCNNYTASHR